MKYLKYLILGLMGFLSVSCGNDDDICTSGEGTPRIKLKFKDSNNKLIQLSKLYIDADYGSGVKNIITKTSADSVLVPLKVDGTGHTDLIVHTSESGAKSTIRINYTEESSYVSPACGIKKNYKNVSSTLQNPNPVKSLEQNQTEITNESKTHLYLIF